MRQLIGRLIPFCAGSLLVLVPLAFAVADDSKKPSKPTTAKSQSKVTKGRASAKTPEKTGEPAPEIDLLSAIQDGSVAVHAVGRGDGRMTLSVTNKTHRPLRVVLPPGIIAQGATGQFGGMGGMGGGMGGMGGGMGGMGGMMGGMGGGMGGMGGGMGGMGGMGGNMGMGGMGGMGRQSGTMPSMMGMMMLSRMIMYFCGDPESWDMRSLMVGMMGGMGGGMGMMGGMGGGMMGGMGGGMGGMGGGMRSVPPTALPSALLNPGQTRHLPTRLVSINPPDRETGLQLPEKDEPLRIVGDVAEANDSEQVQKALRRLSADMAPTSLSQLVMWRVAGGLDWSTITRLSHKWANRHELTLAKDFVDRLDNLPDGETGRILFQVAGADDTSKQVALDLKKWLDGKNVLGLSCQVAGEIPSQPEGPAIACRVRLAVDEASVQVMCTDATAQSWLAYGKFTVPLKEGKEKSDVKRLTAGISEGVLNRLVRAQVTKGTVQEKGKKLYQIRVENYSPLILNALALVGTESAENELPKELAGIAISPRRTLTVPASEEVVKTLGLKKGIRLVALNLSGL
jgi:hypothetical protein